MSWEAVKAQFRSTWLTTIFSLVLFAGVTYFLIWAEKQTIMTSLALEELMTKAVSVDIREGLVRGRGFPPDGENIEQSEAEAYEGRVVHVVGPLRVLEPITEPDYNIQVQAVKLRRRVQMYQWIEETSNEETFVQEPTDESRKTYWYHKEWRDYVVDSSLFRDSHLHRNPTSMPLFSETHIAENVKIGWLYLGLEVKRKVNDYYEVWSDVRPDRSDIKLHSGFYYHGESPLHHGVGDLRVMFTYAGREDDIYTAVGVVERGVMQAYSTASFPASDPVCVLRKGSYSLQQLHDLERRQNNLHTWKYRLLGFVQVFAAAMTLHPEWLSILLRCRYWSASLRHASRLWVNLVFAACYTLVVIACPWMFHKPSYGLTVLGCAVIPLLHYSTLLSRRITQPDPPPAWQRQNTYRT